MKRVFLSLLFAVLIFSSCSVLDRNASIYYNENELSLGDVTEMRHTFPIDEEETKNITLVPIGEADSDKVVYWINGGSVWHKTYTCGYIKDGSEVFYGSEEIAVENGKNAVCSACKE